MITNAFAFPETKAEFKASLPPSSSLLTSGVSSKAHLSEIPEKWLGSPRNPEAQPPEFLPNTQRPGRCSVLLSKAAISFVRSPASQKLAGTSRRWVAARRRWVGYPPVIGCAAKLAWSVGGEPWGACARRELCAHLEGSPLVAAQGTLKQTPLPFSGCAGELRWLPDRWTTCQVSFLLSLGPPPGFAPAGLWPHALCIQILYILQDPVPPKASGPYMSLLVCLPVTPVGFAIFQPSQYVPSSAKLTVLQGAWRLGTFPSCTSVIINTCVELTLFHVRFISGPHNNPKWDIELLPIVQMKKWYLDRDPNEEKAGLGSDPEAGLRGNAWEQNEVGML